MNEEVRKTISENLGRVQERIAEAALRAGRDPDDVQLVVVTKAQPIEKIQAALEAGIRKVGENYPEEGQEKQSVLDPGRELEWHMIGSVQSRKAALVAATYDVVHSLDRVKLARRMHTALSAQNSSLPVLVQVNISGEESKSGFPAWQESHFGSLVEFMASLAEFDTLQVSGLMSIPPFFDEPEAVRPFFRRTRVLRDRLQECFPEKDLSMLSMGMSGDFEVAIEEGATLVRVGTAIMGSRDLR